jgi:hypothetical protein
MLSPVFHNEIFANTFHFRKERYRLKRQLNMIETAYKNGDYPYSIKQIETRFPEKLEECNPKVLEDYGNSEKDRITKFSSGKEYISEYETHHRRPIKSPSPESIKFKDLCSKIKILPDMRGGATKEIYYEGFDELENNVLQGIQTIPNEYILSLIKEVHSLRKENTMLRTVSILPKSPCEHIIS